MKKLVSINIPFFNRLDTLSRCIKSIEAYTPRDLYELVLINDGSTEKEAVEYAEDHADVFVNHPENLGISVSRKDGIESSNCKYICTCDSDIIVTPKWLETLISTFELDHLHPKPNLPPRFDFRSMVNFGIDVKILAPLLYGRVGQTIFGQHSGTYNWILLTGEVGTYCMFFEKSLINLIGNFDEDLYNCWEDLDFSRKVSFNPFNLPNHPVVALDTRVTIYHHGWCDPATGEYFGEHGANTRSQESLVSLENNIKEAKALKILYDRWGIKHSKHDECMELLKKHKVEVEGIVSWKHLKLYGWRI